MTVFAQMVQDELVRSRNKHPMSQTSNHGAYGVLLEEVDEVWDLVKSQAPSQDDLIKELVHVAAMAQRFAEETLGLRFH